MNELSVLYEQDYGAWARQNAELLRCGRFSEIDLDHLLEELEGMGASERNELSNRLRILLMHLLKWQFQLKQLDQMFGQYEGKSWRLTIIVQRDDIARLIRKNPSLKAYFPQALAEAYPEAVDLAVAETELPRHLFPALCPYSAEQLLDNDYYPSLQ